MTKLAKRCGFVPKRRIPKVPDDDPLVLNLTELEVSRSLEKDPNVHHLLGLRLVELKHVLAERNVALKVEFVQSKGLADQICSGSRQIVRYIKDRAGVLYTEEAPILEAVRDVYQYCYGDEASSLALPHWVNKRFSRNDLKGIGRIDGSLIRTVLKRLASGKTCSKQDMVVAEMLVDLPEDVCDILAGIFELRLLNHVSEDSEVIWDEYEVSLIAKKYGAVRVQDFRPIAVWSVFLKMYSMVLAELCSLNAFSLSRFQFAFRKGYQTHEVVSSLRMVIEKAVEFDEPLFVFDGDLHKAYDRVKHSDWIRCHQKRGIPQIIIAAWIREVRRGKARFKLPGLHPASQVSRERSMIQGDPDAPKNFNLFLDDAIWEFVNRCQREEWGYPLDIQPPRPHLEPLRRRPRAARDLTPLLVDADSYWILATSLAMLKAMTNAWHRIIMGKYGCEVILNECKWITTLPDTCQVQMSLDGIPIPRVERAEGLKVWGPTYLSAIVLPGLLLSASRKVGTPSGSTLQFYAGSERVIFNVLHSWTVLYDLL